jgi:hypothetical protein
MASDDDHVVESKVGKAVRDGAPWEGRDRPGQSGSHKPARPAPATPTGTHPKPSGAWSAPPPPTAPDVVSFYKIPSVPSKPPVVLEPLSGDDDLFDPATGWTFAIPEEPEELRPRFDRADGAAPSPGLSVEEIFSTGSGRAVPGPTEPPAKASEVPKAAAASSASHPRSPEARLAKVPITAPPPATLPPPVSLEIPRPSAEEIERALLAASGVDVQVVDDEADEIETGRQAKVEKRADQPWPTDPQQLLARARERMNGADGVEEAVRMLRAGSRATPQDTSLATWREFAERRLLQASVPGALPDRIPQVVGAPTAYAGEASEFERQLLTALDGRRSIARLASAAPDDMVGKLFTTLGALVGKGWVRLVAP